MNDASKSRLLALFLLTLVALFWALNTIIARATADEVPPLALTFWRIFLSALILAPFAWKGCRKAMPVIREHFWLLNLLALLSMSLFNAFVYIGLNHTVAINGNLLQGSLPICILVASAIFVRRRISSRQWLGVALGFVGLLTIVFRGEPGRVLHLAANPGDPLVFLGIFASATYAAILHKWPKGLPLVPFMFVMMLFSSVHTAPFFLWEHFTRETLPMTSTAIGTVLYVTIFASVVAQLLFVEGVRRIGAPAAGNMIYLTPVFGVALAVLALGETFHWFHAAGVAFIAVGIWLALFGKARTAAP